MRCTIIIAITTNGNKKCNIKKRLRQAVLNENPPQIIITTVVPKGKTPANDVMTVAPQNDICLQGNTYPRNEAPITNTNSATPLFQRLPLEPLKFHTLLPIWRMIMKKTMEQKLA
jgi:hypothetical protein